MSTRIVVEALLLVTWWGFRDRLVRPLARWSGVADPVDRESALVLTPRHHAYWLRDGMNVAPGPRAAPPSRPAARRALALGRGTSVHELASRSFFTVADLLAIEAGERGSHRPELREVLGVYGVDPDDLVPERAKLVIDLDEQVLAAGGEQRSLAGRAPTADEVLASYLSLVYTLRHAEPGTRDRAPRRPMSTCWPGCCTWPSPR